MLIFLFKSGFLTTESPKGAGIFSLLFLNEMYLKFFAHLVACYIVHITISMVRAISVFCFLQELVTQ